MGFLVSLKAVRLLLVLSVSVWMAGGCLFGCSNSAMAAETARSAEKSEKAVVAGESCHAARVHDCCAKSKPAKQEPASQTSVLKLTQPKVLTLVATSSGMMNECPLMVNATAVTSKNNGNLPSPERAPVSLLPRIENRTELTERQFVASFPPSRGPTYLRCCVFLI